MRNSPSISEQMAVRMVVTVKMLSVRVASRMSVLVSTSSSKKQ